jgi:hypothetical protein
MSSQRFEWRARLLRTVLMAALPLSAQGRFRCLDDRRDLWEILAVITVRKALDVKEYEERDKRDCRRTVSANHAPASESDPKEPLMVRLISRAPDPDSAAEMADGIGTCSVSCPMTSSEPSHSGSWKGTRTRKLPKSSFAPGSRSNASYGGFANTGKQSCWGERMGNFNTGLSRSECPTRFFPTI